MPVFGARFLVEGMHEVVDQCFSLYVKTNEKHIKKTFLCVYICIYFFSTIMIVSSNLICLVANEK